MWDLVPWLGIEHIPLALEVWSLNYWTTREIPIGNFRYTKDDDIVVSWIQFSSVQFSCSVMSYSLWSPWTAAHQASLSKTNTRSLLKLMSIMLVMPSNHLFLCRSPLLLLSICPSIAVSQFFTSGGQNIGVSASVSVLPMDLQEWSPLGWTGWISLQSKGLSRVFSNTTVQKHQFFSTQL